MWSADDVARHTARRQGKGLNTAQVAGRAAQAARRAHEAQQQAAPDGRPGNSEPAPVAEAWAAQHSEWRRIAALMHKTGRTTYDPDRDAQGKAWERERSARHQREMWAQELRNAKDELRTQIRLPATTGRRLRTIAHRAGLTPEQVLAQLVDHAHMHDDGTVVVNRFTPS